MFVLLSLLYSVVACKFFIRCHYPHVLPNYILGYRAVHKANELENAFLNIGMYSIYRLHLLDILKLMLVVYVSTTIYKWIEKFIY